MPLFLIERKFAEQLDLSPDDVEHIEDINKQLDIQWLFSFLTADKRKTYCLYQASNGDLIRDAARRLNIPADEIVEVDRITPPS